MAGTIYATKEELTEAVVKLVYPNTTKSVTALGNQTAILNVVESIWAQLGSGGAGDLQAVLDLGSLAVIPGDFDVTANGTRLWMTTGGILKFGNTNAGFFSSASSVTGFSHSSSSDSNGPANAGLSVGETGFSITSVATADIASNLECSPSGFKASTKNTNSGGVAMSIVGNPEDNSGYKVSREYDPTNDATALWDINGDLRVREVDELINDTYPLTIDSSGNVHKGVALKLINTFSNNTTLSDITNGDGGRRVAIATSPNPRVVTIPLDLMLVGQEQTIYQLGAGGVNIIGPDVNVIGSATTTNPGDKITIFRVQDNLSFSGQVYIIS